MCTILIAWRCLPGAPLVLAANRDEFIGRPAAAPGILVDHPRIAGGRDLLAGGTWMAVAADGRVAAVTNRRSEMRDPSRRSRGELPLATLAAGDDAGMRRLVEGLDPAAYNPFNLLVVSPELPRPDHSGGDLRLCALLRLLARRHRVDLYPLSGPDETDDSLPHRATNCAPRPKPARRCATLSRLCAPAKVLSV